jgi:hypothetical protein
MSELEPTEKIETVEKPSQENLAENKEKAPDNLNLEDLTAYLQNEINEKSGTHESKENDKNILNTLGRYTKSMIKAIHGVGLDSKIGEGLIALGLFDIAESVGSQTAELVTKNNIAYTIYSSIYESIPHNMITDQVFSMPTGGIDLTQAHLLSPYIPHGPLLFAGLGAGLYVVNKTWNFSDRFSLLERAASLKERCSDWIEGRKTLEEKVNAYKIKEMAKTPKTTSDVAPVKETNLDELIEAEDMPAETVEKKAEKIPAKDRIIEALAGIKKRFSNNNESLGVEPEIVPENVQPEIIPGQRVERTSNSADRAKNPDIIERKLDEIYERFIKCTGGVEAKKEERFSIIKAAIKKRLKQVLLKAEAEDLDLEQPVVVNKIVTALSENNRDWALVSAGSPNAKLFERIEEAAKILRQKSEAARAQAAENKRTVSPVADLQAAKIRLNLDNEIHSEE